MSDLPILVGGYKLPSGGASHVLPILGGSYEIVPLPDFTRSTTGTVQSLTYDPLGRYYAFGGYNYCEVWNIETGARDLQVLGFGDRLAAFSPNGQWLAIGRESSITSLYDAATLTFVRNLSSSVASLEYVDFTPDGATVALTDYYGRVQIHRTSDGVLLRTINVTEAGILSAVLSFDGARVVVTNYHGETKIYSTATGAELDDLGLNIYGTNAISHAVRSKNNVIVSRRNGSFDSLQRTYILSSDLTEVVHSFSFGGRPYSSALSDIVLIWNTSSYAVSEIDIPALTHSVVMADASAGTGLADFRFALPPPSLIEPAAFWTQRIRATEVI